jgi:hypothetical protein
MEQNNKFLFLAVALIVGLIAGYILGAQSGKKMAVEEQKKTEELQTTIDVFVPPLPDVVNVIGGKITAINGDTFIMEIPSFTDRYPKPGQAMATETRTIRITTDTKITDTNFDQKTFKNGLPQTRTITAKDLKTDDTVSVTVKENARTEQNLTAEQINRSSGI